MIIDQNKNHYKADLFLCLLIIVPTVVNPSHLQATSSFENERNQIVNTDERPRAYARMQGGFFQKLALCCGDDDEPDQNRRASMHIGRIRIAVQDTRQETLWDEFANALRWCKEKIWGRSQTHELPGNTRIQLDW